MISVFFVAVEPVYGGRSLSPLCCQWHATTDEPLTLGDLDFSKDEDNGIARRRFKNTLSGIINVRTDGQVFSAARRVQASYQWESYGPIDPIETLDR